MSEKKLIAAFRNYVEKIFLPTFKKTDPQTLQWNKFSRLLSSQAINYDQIFRYVDAINAGQSNYQNSSLEKKEIPFMRKKPAEESLTPPKNEAPFNPSKTFGGQRARMMFIKGEIQQPLEQKKQGFNTFGMGSRAQDPSKRNFGGLNGQTVLPGLQRLCRQFLQNQKRIQNMLMQAPRSPTKYG